MSTKAQEAKEKKLKKKYKSNTLKYKTRLFNRCKVTGRARGYMRRFGISRITFREFALKGLLPGVRKASW
ncbi:type Z 30S ribosomal protein S14 [Candidatus Dojkabacteria bacterium]|nr:type Z 30S ribosomal protein S14 [Candidatus Dojkabacteria bacterium]